MRLVACISISRMMQTYLKVTRYYHISVKLYNSQMGLNYLRGCAPFCPPNESLGAKSRSRKLFCGSF